MRLLVISDIHGDIDALNKVLDNELYDKVLFLGDMYSYYGGYSDSEIRNKLFSIYAYVVSGNCDRRINAIYNIPEVLNIECNDTIFTLTHGDLYNEFIKPENCGNVLLVGHTHRGRIENEDGLIIANPGSISKPRGCSASYIIVTDTEIILKDMDKNIINKMNYKH